MDPFRKRVEDALASVRAQVEQVVRERDAAQIKTKQLPRANGALCEARGSLTFGTTREDRMITVTIHRKTLEHHRACAEGLALYDAIAALQAESDTHRECIKIANWTRLHSLWPYVAGYGEFARWLEAHGIIPRADFSGADLSGVDFYDTDLSGANFSRADLSGADLFHADLSGANLSHADLSHADLSGADLYGADLSHAVLSGAKLVGSDLSHADLSGANLSHADLSGAKLSGANLSGADLSGAYRGSSARER